MVVKETSKVYDSNMIIQEELQDEVLNAISLYKELYEDLKENAPYESSSEMEAVTLKFEEAREYLFHFVKSQA
jgi:hypothetical protein